MNHFLTMFAVVSVAAFFSFSSHSKAAPARQEQTTDESVDYTTSTPYYTEGSFVSDTAPPTSNQPKELLLTTESEEDKNSVELTPKAPTLPPNVVIHTSDGLSSR